MPITPLNWSMTTHIAASVRVLASGWGRFGGPKSSLEGASPPFVARAADFGESRNLDQNSPDHSVQIPRQGVGVRQGLREGLMTRAPVVPRKIASGQRPGSGRASLLQGLGLPVLTQSSEAATLARLSALYAAMAEAGDWPGLFQAQRIADSERAPSPGGGRLAALISGGARAKLQHAIDQGDMYGAQNALEQLSDIRAQFANDPVAAQILAQAFLDFAHAVKARAKSHQTGREWQEFLALVGQAELVIEPFDPIEEDLPQLAATRYRLVTGIDAGRKLFCDWYEDWSDLDPGATEPHLEHARHILPDCLGRGIDFDAEARRAAENTKSRSRDAAYALFHLVWRAHRADYAPGLDAGRMIAGLFDHAAATGCQMRANEVAGYLIRMAQDPLADPDLRAGASGGVVRHLRQGGLREFHLKAWDGGEAQITQALRLAFAYELASGRSLKPGPEGIVAVG